MEGPTAAVALALQPRLDRAGAVELLAAVCPSLGHPCVKAVEVCILAASVIHHVCMVANGHFGKVGPDWLLPFESGLVCGAGRPILLG